MAKKYYGIKKGFDYSTNKEIANVIVESWDECLKRVKGVKGAIYKSFQSLEEAKNYLREDTRILKKGVDNYPTDVPHAYVDGSFNSLTGKYGYGVVVIHNDVIIHVESGTAKDDSEKSLRQIAGELKAAIRAAEFAVSQKFSEIVIFHDYEGICHHATGSWERRDKSSQLYFEQINDIKKIYNLNIIFVKVDSHTNDFFNELADEEAKKGAGLNINGSVDKLIRNIKINVSDFDIKRKVEELVSPQYREQVIVAHREAEKPTQERTGNLKGLIQTILEFQNDETLKKYIESLDDNTKNELIIGLHNIVKNKMD